MIIEKLYSLQDRVLNLFSEFARENSFPFNFSGGTALVRFYARKPYRVSYDLDFFSTYGIKNFNFMNLENFLKKEFNKIETIDYLSNTTPLYRINIYEDNIALKVDFIEDLFSGSFEGERLKNLYLKVEPIFAIYTRKIWALISSLENENIDWNRLKDLIDIIYLETLHSDFEVFIKNEFRDILLQNGVDISIGKIQSYLSFIEENILQNYNLFRRLLSEEYKSSFSLEEVLKWIEKKQRILKQM